jgi:hypothetical protein
MLRNILLTALLIVAIVIAIEMRATRPRTQAEPELSAVVQECLDRRIPNLVIYGGTYREAIEQMKRATGVPINVDWTTIPKWDAQKIDIELHDIALGDAVAYLFRMDRMGFSDAEQVDFEILNDHLFITSSKRFPPSAVALRLYDVRDLLTDQYWGCASGPDPTQTQLARLDALARLIEAFAGSRNWIMGSRRGGSHGLGEEFGYGDIRFGAGRLFVNQTTRGHRQVEAALERLRNGGIPPVARNP